MSNSKYACISGFGQSVSRNDPTQDPLTYCLLRTIDAPFQHGALATTISGKYSKNCQSFMSDYCAKNWDGVCEFASQDRNTQLPNNLQTCSSSGVACDGLNAGEILIANTAAKKYLTQMGCTCFLKYEPFDPTVAGSPMISYFNSTCNNQGNQTCIPVYAVNPTTIDKDNVMNKILDKPIIAWSVLINIYNTAVRLNKLDELKGTKIHAFFTSKQFQEYIKMRYPTHA